MSEDKETTTICVGTVLVEGTQRVIVKAVIEDSSILFYYYPHYRGHPITLVAHKNHKMELLGFVYLLREVHKDYAVLEKV